MLKYDLLGQTVVFEDAAERYYDLLFASNQACLKASQQFKAWYSQRGNIQAVLDGYLPFAESLVEQMAFRPLFSQLAACEIYDMSEETYWKRCIGLGESESALETVERQYNQILRQQNAEQEYRADRKAGRGRWVGGGFGLGAALKGATQAAALNAVSSLGHSAFNAIGNAGSALSASMDKSALYKNSTTQDTLLRGILTDLYAVYFAHIDLVNEYKSGYIRSTFNEDKSSALFENAKKLPDKQKELLVQAFTLCPWSAELVKYIFIHFPKDRKNVYAAAQRFYVDLSSAVEEILSQEYTEEAQSSEQATQAAKERILEYMREYGVPKSATLDRLETDRLRRLCEGYQTADEETCNKLIAAIKAHDAPDALKAPFLQAVQARIESIWSAEDGEIFDNLYMKTDITDPHAVAESIAYVQSKGRTDSSQKYLDALNACTPENIERARMYHHTNRYKLYIVVAILLIPLAWTLIISIPLFYMAWNMKNAWKLLTVNGTMLHPALLSVPPQGKPKRQK